MGYGLWVKILWNPAGSGPKVRLLQLWTTYINIMTDLDIAELAARGR
jgi:hypothetical protein